MATAPASDKVVRFGQFEANPISRELRASGVLLRLPDQSFRVLMLLLERPGEMVTREEIRKKLWPDETFVDFDHGLNNAVSRLREALGDSVDSPTFIQTLPRRGYRFIRSLDQDPATDEANNVRKRRLAIKFSSSVSIAVFAVLAISATGAYFLASRLNRNNQVQSARVMVAVLPFENLSSEPDQEYFAEGFTDELITQLSRFRPDQLGVIARTSAISYKSAKKSAKEMSRELGVDYLVEGTVSRTVGQVKITAQLVNVQNQVNVWANSYESNDKDIISLQRELATEIARNINVRLAPGARNSAVYKREVKTAAYEDYLRGRYFWNKRTKEGFVKAIGYFEQAIANQPDYAEAYAGLSDSYALLGVWPVQNGSRHEAMARARASAIKALEIDDSIAEAHASLASISMIYDWNWPLAGKEFRRAIDLNPSYPTAHHWYAFYCASQGRTDEAITEIRVAQKLDPLSVIINTDVGHLLYFAHRFDEAIAQSKRAAEMDPTFPWPRVTIGLAYLEKGGYPEAIKELQTAVQMSRDKRDILSFLGLAYARAGRRADAEKVLQQLTSDSSTGYDSLLKVAWIYAALGERDRAFAWVDRVYSSRSLEFYPLKVQPFVDFLRDDPRFEAVVRRVGLPE